MKKLTLLLLILSFFLLPLLAFALEGKVVSIADGDTVTILTSAKEQVKIRLYGIDCPENNQPFSKAAKKAVSKMLFGKYVQIEKKDADRYERVVGVVKVNGVNVNEEMIREGYAWQYEKYCNLSFCDHWLNLEQRARLAKIGLWADHDPVPPWDWRRGVRSRSYQKSSEVYSNTTGKYHGNIKSHVFHTPTCPNFNCKNCTQVFRSREDAINRGYQPCGICRP